MIEWLNTYYKRHIQKTLAVILATLASADILGALVGVQNDLTTLIGAKVYAAIHLTIAAGIYLRARQA